MKSLSLTEVAQMSITMQSLAGHHLQDALQTASEVGLGLYGERETIWLWVDLHPQRPVLVRIAGRAPKRKKITRPLTLFLRSNFFGRRLESVRADLSQGRVLYLDFFRSVEEQAENPGPCEIEIRLFPRGQNVLARCGRKSISEIKPKELAKVGQTSFGESFLASDAPTPDNSSVRSWDAISAEWQSEQARSPQSPAASGSPGPGLAPAAAANVQDATVLNREYRRAIEKKSKALERMREDLNAKKRDSELFRKLGEALKQDGTLDQITGWPLELAADAREKLNLERSLSWNIEMCFTRAKDIARKVGGTADRIEIVERELLSLQSRGSENFLKKRESDDKKGANNLLSKSDAHGRRLDLGEGLEVYIGKSASDNLALLRRAQAFDYWLHLRDQPGSHAILRRGRQRIVTDQEFQTAGRWVIEQSLGARAKESLGERFDLLIVECRYVRPIKGDRLGRVNYSNDRVLSIRYEPASRA